MPLIEARGSCRAVGLLILFWLVVCGLQGCSREDRRAQPPTEVEPRPASKPDVILISLDTLRADHLGCYGYERPTSPRIDDFAGRATLYTRALAAASWTVPTHASLFTGKFPYEHGAHNFEVSQPVNNANPLPQSHLTLAEALKSEGYDTGAFVANWAYLGRRWQLDQGFDTYHAERTYARELNRGVFDWLAAQSQRTFFLFINYIDTHRPYNTTPREGLLDRPVVQDKDLIKVFKEKVLFGEEPTAGELTRQIIDQYDTSIANVDQEVGALLDRLRAANLYDNAMIVLTSDHGEFFGEHGLVLHSKDVYEEVLRVPLIVKAPGQRVGRVSDTLTTSTDIPNLVLSQLPRPVAERYRLVFPDAPGNHLVIAENRFTHFRDLCDERWGHRFRRVRRAVYDWPYKYIHSSDGDNELYHLVEDPAESDNLIERQPEVADRLARALMDLETRRPRWEGEVDTSPLTDQEWEKLRSLGYVGE